MSTNTDYREHGSFARRHDLLLALLPLPLLLGAVVGATTAVSLTTGLWAGSLLSLPVLCYAVFVDPPAPALIEG
ncbi:hypothetical protein [Halolamina sp. C58]|uniref:hypothetical protein n=1 Tax=Halolamina sp. C58 TaxID=3421640 RepID=UPI003EC094D0